MTPWNSPGQNTGVGSLSLLQASLPTQGRTPGLPRCGRILVCLLACSLAASFRTLGWTPSCPGIVPTLAVGLPSTCRQIPHQLSHQGSPRILEWVVYPFSSGSSRHRNRTEVSCIAGRFFTNWAMREAPHRDHRDHLSNEPPREPEASTRIFPFVRDLDSLTHVSRHRNHWSNFHSGIWRHPLTPARRGHSYDPLRDHLQPAWSIYPTFLGMKRPASPPNSRMQRSGACFTVTDSTQPRHLQKNGKCNFPMRTKGNSSLVKEGPTAAHQRSLVAGSRSPRACFLRLILNMLPAQRVCRLPWGVVLRGLP